MWPLLMDAGLVSSAIRFDADWTRLARNNNIKARVRLQFQVFAQEDNLCTNDGHNGSFCGGARRITVGIKHDPTLSAVSDGGNGTRSRHLHLMWAGHQRKESVSTVCDRLCTT